MTQQDYKPSNDKVEPRPKSKKKPSKFTAVKDWTVSHWNEAMYVTYQLGKLVTAGALLTVSGYAFWTAYTHTFAIAGAREWVLFSGILIGLLGAGQFLKTLGKK